MADITVALEINPSGTNPTELTTRSYTLSCEPMWQHAGVDIAQWDSERAIHVISTLQTAITDMTDNPATYTPLNPPDETGDYDGCLAFLQGLLTDFCNHPKATIRIT
jgi:hypothetical protein